MKTALITGGSRGIGAALVRRFTKDNWRVVFSYCSSKEQAQALARETGALPFRADLRKEQDTLALADYALKQLCHVDACIVNAGACYTGLLGDMPLDAWDNLFALNLRSPFVLIKALLPAMRKQGSGALLLMSSIWGQQGASCEAAYAATKAGLISLAQSLSKEEGPAGIRVNALCPGVIRTDMLSGYTAEELETLRQHTPLCRLGEAEDVAHAAFFLCSEEAAFITGQTLTVDGGFL